jgi:hypothetical protein
VGVDEPPSDRLVLLMLGANRPQVIASHDSVKHRLFGLPVDHPRIPSAASPILAGLPVTLQYLGPDTPRGEMTAHIRLTAKPVEPMLIRPD